MKIDYKKVLIVVILTLIGLISFFVVSNVFTNPETYKEIINYLDEKKNIVTALASSSAAASAAITLLPGDTGSSIANTLADFSSKFLIVMIALYLEKYLLTIIGFIAFKIIIPISCILLIIYIIWEQKLFVNLGTKLFILAITMMLMIPSGVWTSQMVENVYSYSIQESIDMAVDTANDIVTDTDKGNTDNTNNTTTNNKKNTDKSSFLEVLTDIYYSLQEIVENVKESASAAINNVVDYVGSIPDKIVNILNSFTEALAVLLITSCVIPILVIMLFGFVIKLLFGIDIDLSRTAKNIDNKTKNILNKNDN